MKGRTERYPDTPIRRAVRLAGGVLVVAELCEVSRNTVHHWLRDGSIPKRRDAIRLGAIVQMDLLEPRHAKPREANEETPDPGL